MSITAMRGLLRGGRSVHRQQAHKRHGRAHQRREHERHAQLPRKNPPYVNKMIGITRRFADLLLRGDFYGLTENHRSNKKWTVFQFDRPECCEGALLQVLRNNQAPEESITVYPRQLAASTRSQTRRRARLRRRKPLRERRHLYPALRGAILVLDEGLLRITLFSSRRHGTDGPPSVPSLRRGAGQSGHAPFRRQGLRYARRLCYNGGFPRQTRIPPPQRYSHGDLEAAEGAHSNMETVTRSTR